MKRPTRILAIVGALIVLVLALLLVLPLLFRDRIARAREDRGEPEPQRPRRLAGRRPQLLPGLPQPHPHARRPHRRRRGPVPGRHARRGPAPPGGAGPGQRAAERHGAAAADRRPRRRARPAAAPADRARGRHRQLGHHEEDRRDGAAGRSREADGDQPPAVRDQRRRRRLRQPQGEAQGVAWPATINRSPATSARTSSPSRPRPTPTR